MKPRTRNLLWRLLLPLVFWACTEEQYTEQFEELQVQPSLESSLFYLRSTEEVINVFGGIGSVYEEEFEFDAFSQDFVDDRILEGFILYEIDNTTSKPLRIEVDFLNEDQLLDTEQLQVSAYEENYSLQVFYGPGDKPLEILANTTVLRVRVVNLGDNVSESTLPSPSLVFRSSFQVTLTLL